MKILDHSRFLVNQTKNSRSKTTTIPRFATLRQTRLDYAIEPPFSNRASIFQSSIHFLLPWWADNNSWRLKITWIDDLHYHQDKAANPIQTTRRQMRWSKHRQTIGWLTTDCRSTFDILAPKVYLSEVFFSLCWEINLSQMQFYFALITNSIFFSLSCDTPHFFRACYIIRRKWRPFTLRNC